MKPRHDFFAEQAQGGHHPLVRDQPAAIQLGKDAVDALGRPSIARVPARLSESLSRPAC
jgi:hypothetical protein